MKRPHFLYHDEADSNVIEFHPKPRPRYAHPWNWPLLVGVAIAVGIMGGCFWLVYEAMHFYGGLQ